jgi:malonyl CoA-acyl carrier protein transacylase
MKTYLFPGQGSQTKGMGAGLFERYADLVAQADAVLGYSIRELCLDDPRAELNKTQFTQPALYTVNALTYFARRDDGAAAPDYFAGHSLGEFNALMAAGCFDFVTGLKLVRRRGELMGQVSGGAMAAVLNASKADIEATLAQHGLDGIDLANYNSPSQIVISGTAEDMAKAAPLFKQGKVRFYPLNTSGAFHSRHMRDAMMQFRDFLDQYTFCAPTIPVISNVTAQPYDGANVVDTLSRQIANTVQWTSGVQYLLAQARRSGQTMTFEELGPGEVLTKLVDAIAKQTPDSVLDALIGAAPAVTGKPANAADKVKAWNAAHPVGTRVKSTIADYDALETRTEAVVLFGHRAAVYMKGYNGYFDLDEVVAA